MLNNCDSKITEVLDEANILFKEGMCDEGQRLHTVTLFVYYLVKFIMHIIQLQ